MVYVLLTCELVPETEGGEARPTVPTFFLSYSLVRSLRSRSASARRTVCCNLLRSLVRSVKASV